MLSVAAKAIRKLSERHALTADETTKVLDLLIREDTDSYFFFAFTLAMHTKGETSDELLGVCRSIEHITPRVHVDIPASQMIDVSGTGGDLLNTLNVSTATAFVVASHGLFVPKQAFFSVTGYSGSADLMLQLGVDVPELSGSPDRVSELLQTTGISMYHFLISLPEECVGMSNWISKRREIGLNFKTFMHLVGFAYSPFRMDSRLYGVYNPRYLMPLAELFEKLGYKRVLVVHGVGGLDEISVIGPTEIAELRDGVITHRRLSTRDLGLRQAQDTEILSYSKEDNIRDFIRILYKKERGPKRDLVLANAGAALYLTNAASTIREGIDLARDLVDTGKASAKLEEYVAACNGSEQLEEQVSKYTK